MSSQYITEPPPTASVLLHTTAGSLTISIFAQQVPLTARNFLQHCLDGDYDGNLFHRVAPGFVIQTGDPTGTGEGGQSIYEDREFERYDKDWANVMKRDVEGEKITFGDEIHTRLKFNRRGLVGLAKGTGNDNGYGSQFFITLGDCRAELDGKCTMFGRVEGDGIYNVVKVAEGECIEGTERPMYPEKILSVEVLEMPSGAAWQKMTRRIKVATRTTEEDKSKKKTISTKKKKGAKALLSFGGDEGEDGESVVVRPKKAKFNTALINGHDETVEQPKDKPKKSQSVTQTQKSSRQRSPSPSRPIKRKAEAEPEPTLAQPSHRSSSPKRRKPSFHDSTTQLPLRNPESPSRTPTPASESSPPPSHLRRTSSSQNPTTSSLQAEIAALKQSMRRDVGSTAADSKSKPKSALESLIPTTSIRGRKRPRPGANQSNEKDERKTMKSLDAFRARMEKAMDSEAPPSNPSEEGRRSKDKPSDPAPNNEKTREDREEEDGEARLCDLHFIANCQSCFAADDMENNDNDHTNFDKNNNDKSFLGHALSFEKDRLGKDLTWKRKNEEELVVIDPREREKDLGIGMGKKDRGRTGKDKKK